MTLDPLPAAVRADRRAAHCRELMAMTRSRADLTAKGLGAIGGAVVSAIGLAKFADIFPFEGPWWAMALLIAGIGLMLWGLIGLVVTTQRLAEPIMADIDPEVMVRRNKLGDAEGRDVGAIYARMARLNGADSLRAYNARAHRFERISDRVGGSTAEALRLRADAIRAEVLAVQDRAVLLTLGRRTTRTLCGRKAVVLMLMLPVGLICASVGADQIAAQRSEHQQGTRAASAAGALPRDLP